MSFPLAFLSLIIERVFGYPQPLFKAVGHPVTWIGALISVFDRVFNSPRRPPRTRRIAGIACAVVLVLLVVPGFVIEFALGWSALGVIATALLASTLLAQKSLESHVAKVADAIDAGGVEAGRKAVAMIVGRDPERLDEAGVARAAIESLAENFSDGVVAPALWLGVAGLGGGLAYKAINTADSMIGHRTPRHEMFGWASARLDDLVNLPASRLSAVLIILAAAITPKADTRAAWRAVVRDAQKHRSPNAGWPEAAMAGALGLSLAGPRVYDGVLVNDAMMGQGKRNATPGDIRRALQIYQTADALLIILIGSLSIIEMALT